MLPLRGLTIDEGLHADFFVLGVKEVGKRLGFNCYAVGESFVERCPDGLLSNP